MRYLIIFLICLQATSCQAAQITINVPNNLMSRILDAFAFSYEYKDRLCSSDGNCVDNPETKAVFVRRILIDYIKAVVRDAELTKSKNIAAQSITDIDLGQQ